MGLLTGGNSSAKGLLGLGGTRNVKNSSYPENFPDGMILCEIVNGVKIVKDQVQLVGKFMPHQPFEFGGSQQLSKEYYPGNSEPTVHVLGSREENTKISGVMKTKNFSDTTLREAAVEYQQLIEAMRLRGNLVVATMGTWVRYGFIEKAMFKLMTEQEIAYEIDFFVVGFNPPTLDKTTRGDGSMASPNRAITSAAAQALLNQKNFPDEMPVSLQDQLNDIISGVAEKINLVTNFVNEVQADINSVISTANRAMGLIKNARSFISKARRDIGSMMNNAAGLAGAFANEAEKTANTLKNVEHLHKVTRDYSNLSAMLAGLQLRFAALASTVPMVRHLVRQGDSLQTLAQKYYQNAELWKKIYDHNKLTTTTLVVGSVLEIPKL